MPANQKSTTEVTIPANNQTLVDLLARRYGGLDAANTRAELELNYSPVWDESEFAALYVLEFLSPPYAHVVHRDSGKRGTVMYLDEPRFYFLFNYSPEDTNG